MARRPPKVPVTITDAQMAGLRRRAMRGPDAQWFTGRAISRRKASDLQRRKSRWS
jgi:hypothetical protein